MASVIKANVGGNGTVRLASPAPLMRDSALDSDIIWHEYGHGLTWRMIGGMSGAMAGAIGEGMGDVLAIIDQRARPRWRVLRVGSGGDSLGAVWLVQQDLQDRLHGHPGASRRRALRRHRVAPPAEFRENRKDDLLTYLVDGMNFTPSTPKFEQMRDGILTSVTDTDDECKVWEAFAHFGVGVGASATQSRRGTWTITESFTEPASCTP